MQGAENLSHLLALVIRVFRAKFDNCNGLAIIVLIWIRGATLEAPIDGHTLDTICAVCKRTSVEVRHSWKDKQSGGEMVGRES